MERLQGKTVKNMEDKERSMEESSRRRKFENMFGSSLLLFIIACTLIVLIAVAPTIINGDTDTVRNLVEAQIQTTTTDSNIDTEETISAEANRSRLDGSQPDSSPIQGTGIPSELTNANPAPQAPISGMEVLTRENETREGTGAFTDLANTTR
jgi:cytoskeletal protein RodZ